jgi:hypothetical protein
MAAGLVEVRSLGRNGPDVLRLSSSHFDPKRTSAQRGVAEEVSLNAFDTDSDRTGPIENRNVTKHPAK